MQFCTSCGTKILENQKFCSGCGQKIENTLEQSSKTETKPTETKVIQSEKPKDKTIKKGGLGKSILRISLAVIAIVAIAIVGLIIYEAVKRNKLDNDIAIRNAEILKKNAEIERISEELKSNPNKYVTGSNCIATTEGAITSKVTKKLTKGVVDISIELLKNCTFENKSSFWIKGINGSVFAKNTSGVTTEIKFSSDCILQPQEKKPCNVTAGDIINGHFDSGIVQVTDVGYSSNGEWEDDKIQIKPEEAAKQKAKFSAKLIEFIEKQNGR